MNLQKTKTGKVDENTELNFHFNKVTHRTMTELRIAIGILKTNARTGTIVFALHIPFVTVIRGWCYARLMNEVHAVTSVS